MERFSMHYVLPILLVSCFMTSAVSVDWDQVRFGPQVSVGSSGFEFGGYAEFDILDDQYRLRPELFIHDKDRPAGAFAFLWHTTFLKLPAKHDFYMGPRVAYHNGEDNHDPRGELSYMALYNLPIPPLSADTRHHLEIFAALGLVDKDGTEFSATAGAGYFFKF
jgi:hypothetical protein